MSRRVLNLGARLRRSRALALCLGRRSVFVKPLDRRPGRPTIRESAILAEFSRPQFQFDPEDYDDQDTLAWLDNLIVDRAMSYLDACRMEQGWFEVVERAQLLGTSATIRVRHYDLFVMAPDLFRRSVGSFVRVPDRRRFFEYGRAANG